MKNLAKGLLRIHSLMMVFGAIIAVITNIIVIYLHRSILDESLTWLMWGFFVPGLVIGFLGTALWPIDSYIKYRKRNEAR